MGKESRRRQPRDNTVADTMVNQKTHHGTYPLDGPKKALLITSFAIYMVYLGFTLTQPLETLFPKQDHFTQPQSILFVVEYALFACFATICIRLIYFPVPVCTEEIGLLLSIGYLYPLSLLTFLGHSWTLSFALNCILLVVCSGWILFHEKMRRSFVTASMYYAWILAKSAWLVHAWLVDKDWSVLIFILMLVGLFAKALQHRQIAFVIMACIFAAAVFGRLHETRESWLEMIDLFWERSPAALKIPLDVNAPDF